MDPNVLYWFFSTIAQTLAVIVAVIGMLIVYRLQNISQCISMIMNNSYEHRLSLFKGRVVTQRAEEFIEDIESKNIELEEAENQRRRPPFSVQDLRQATTAANEIILLSKERDLVKRTFFIFLIPHLAAILIPIILLPYANILATFSKMIIILFAIVFIYTFYSIYKISKILLAVGPEDWKSRLSKTTLKQRLEKFFFG